MKRTLIALALTLCTPLAFGETSVKVDTGSHTKSHSSNADHQKMQPLRASELMGLTVTNSKDETVGSVNDIVLNRKDGSVKYVAVSIGGFLGIGDKLFAVPFKKFDCKQVDGEHELTLNVDRKTLENIKGFDQDNWPNMADNNWRMMNDKSYGN